MSATVYGPTLRTREDVHAALRSNAQRRDALRPVVMAAIREGREAPEAYQLREVLADDERLMAVHLRFCRNIGCGVG